MELVLSNNNNYAGILLTGTGDYFSSGADLTSSHDVVVTTNDTHDNDTTDTISTLQHRPAGQFMKQWISFPKLKCAAVNGPAIGIAVTLFWWSGMLMWTTQALAWRWSAGCWKARVSGLGSLPSRIGTAKTPL